LSIFFGWLRLIVDERHNPLQVVNRGELNDDLAFGPAQFDLHPSLEVVRKPIGEILDFGRNDLGLTPLPGSLIAVIA
jgi:hypothetical protein